MSNDGSFRRWKHDITIAIGAGVASAVLMGLTSFVVGNVTNGEARVLLEAMMPTSRFLCSAVMTATATILALMLTMIGMSINVDAKISKVFYHRIQQIAFYDMLVLVASTCFLVIHCIPITESDEVPTMAYSIAYYTVLAMSALMGGAIVVIVGMLYAATRDVIRAFGLDDDCGLRQTGENKSQTDTQNHGSKMQTD